MLAAVASGASHPVVAGLLGLSAAAVAGVLVAMAWSVHLHQFRLAEQLARRQFIVTGQAGAASGDAGEGAHLQAAAAAAGAAYAGAAHGAVADAGAPRPGAAQAGAAQAGANGAAANGAAPAPVVVIEGPDTVIAGDQVRYRVPPSDSRKVVAWAAGGGSVAQAPDPAHPEELLLTADQPGDLTVTVRVREGMTERRATKSVTAVPEVTASPPPFALRLFLHGWGLVVVAVLVAGFAGSLVALGSLSAADFVALVAPLAALLAVIATAWRGSESGPAEPGQARPPRPY